MAEGPFYSAGYEPGGKLSDQAQGSAWGNDTGWSDNYDTTGLNPDGSVSVAPGDPGYVLKRGPSGAQQDIGRYRALADAARNGRMDMSGVNPYLNQANAGLGLMQSAAYGQQPSVAEAQMQRGLGQAMANQQALASGARGAGAMGVAQASAAQGMAGMQAAGVANAAQLRAAEMAAARQAYFGGASSLANMQGDWALRQAQLNAAGAREYEGMGFDVNKAQLQANLEEQGIQKGIWEHQSNLDEHSTDSYNPLRMISDERAKTPVRLLMPGDGDARRPGDGDASTKPLLPGDGDARRPGDGDARRPGDGDARHLVSDEAAKAQVDDGEEDRRRMQAFENAVGGYQSGGAIGMGKSMLLGAAMSDERAKAPLARARSSELDAASDATPPVTYAYKDGVPGTTPGVPQAGITAQNALRHPLTAAMVRKDPHSGLMELDVPTATSFNLARGSEHSQRIRHLENTVSALAAARRG